VTKGINDAERVTEELQDFLQYHEKISAEKAVAKTLCVTSASKHQPNLAKLTTVDSPSSTIEWIISVSMLSEGWDVKNVFQIVPHEERAFNSGLLIAQVLGRGLRRPDNWSGEEPVVTVFNHDAWSGRIRHLVNEILELERRLASSIDRQSGYNFDLDQLDYRRHEDTTEYTKRGEYNLFREGFIELPTQIESEDVIVEFERAVSQEREKFRSTIRHKTWSVDEVAEQMFQRLKSIDEESRSEANPRDRTKYANKFTLAKCKEIVKESLRHANIKSQRIIDDNRQKFLQTLGPLRRKSAKRVIYKLSPKALIVMNTSERQVESCSAAELRRGSKAVFYADGCEDTLADEQREFFFEVDNEDGEFIRGRAKVANSHDFKTAANLAIADAGPERSFMRELSRHENAQKIDAWLKNTPIGFYTIEYAWKKGEHPKRGEFSPDLFIKQGKNVFVIEIKGNEEIADPAADNIKKYEYAMAHFARVNNWLNKEGVDRRYQFRGFK
jgi:type III restriction enzyme